jgi:hypothetical protein
MRRSLLALLLSAGVCLVLSASAFSTDPGGWNHIGGAAPGLNGHVTALHRVGTVLYLDGNFTNAGGIAAARATFAVTASSTVGTPPDVVKGIVRAT